MISSKWFKRTLVALIILGIIFRFVNLNHKVYGQQEVYTTLQAAGYFPEAVEQELFQNRLVTPLELQKYQQVKPGSTAFDTIQSLAIATPLNPPLYFLVLRSWMQALGESLAHLFKSPLTTMRSLPALISLLALPAMYSLAWELFASRTIALVATMLVAISPFDVLLAQTAQPYSLLTVLVIASSFFLLRAIRGIATSAAKQKSSNLTAWGLYSLLVTAGLYTHSFFGLTVISHIGYVLGLLIGKDSLKLQRKILIRFSLALAIAIVAFLPWIVVVLANLQSTRVNIQFIENPRGIQDLFKQWILSFTTAFFDLEFGFANPWTFLARVPFLLLIGVAVYQVYHHTVKVVWLLLVLLIGVPFLLLLLPDAIWDGYRSTVNLYLIPAIPAVQLAVAYFLVAYLLKVSHLPTGDRLQSQQVKFKSWFWRGILSVLLIANLASLIVSAASNSWWDKDFSYFNDRTAETINVVPDAIILTDIGNDYINTGDLLSLSYRLQPDTKLLLIATPEFIETEKFKTAIQGKTAIVFRPSKLLQQILEQIYGQVTPMLAGERLWKISGSSVKN